MEIKDIESNLISNNIILTLDCLAKIDQKTPTRAEATSLKKAMNLVKEATIAFQIKKSLRLAVFKIKKVKFKVELSGLEKLLQDHNRLEDLALGIATVEAVEAFLACDLFRSANWQYFPDIILISFCNFFKKYGSIIDAPTLIELTRHQNHTIIAAAIAALEKLDPSNLQSIIIPLLDSPINEVKIQAIQAFYRWNHTKALKYLLELLFSEDEENITLALHHASAFPYPEIESYLLQLISQNSSHPVLISISHLLKNNANLDTPFKLLWLNRTLSGQHQSFVKGMILGLAKTLSEKKLLAESVEDYLAQLQIKIKKEEDRLVEIACEVTTTEVCDSNLDEFGDSNNFMASKSSDIKKEHVENKDKEIIHISTRTQYETLTISSNPSVQSSTIPLEKQNIIADLDFEKYNEINENARTKILVKIKAPFFKKNNKILTQKLQNAHGKELIALINLFRIFGKPEDSEKIKIFLKNKSPDVICAAIKALAILDQEHLCLHLPYFLQDKNGKIRITAIRALITIDREAVKSLLTSLIDSSDIRRRMMGVSMSMLIDFNTVRQPLINALYRESSIEIVEKIGMVLASNPDRDTLNEVYLHAENCKTSLMDSFKKIADQIADKLSITLNNINTKEELLEEAKKVYEQKKEKETDRKESVNKNLDSTSNSNLISSKTTNKDITIQEILIANIKDPKAKKAKLTIIIWILVIIGWACMLGILIVRFLFGA